MQIYVNDNPVNLKNGKSLCDLMKEMHLNHQKGIAVAVNDSVLSTTEWARYQLNENDSVLIITATQGG